MIKHTTGLVATVTALLLFAAERAGVSMSNEVAAAIVGIAAIVTSALFPRWAELRGVTLDAHPAALTGFLTTVAVWLAPLIGLELSPADAVALVGGLTLIVSLFTPRDPESHLFPAVYGDAADASHDDVTRDVDPAAEVAAQGRTDRLDP